jgi:hypothetical protein
MTDDRREPEPTQPVEVGDATQPMELGDATQPVDVGPDTAPFAPVEHPAEAPPLVSSTAANMLLADALPQPAAPEPAIPDPTSGLDTLFAEDRFRDHDAEQAAAAAAVPPAPVADHEVALVVAPPHMTRTQRTLLIVAGALVALVALGALFFLGTRLPVAASASASPTPTSTPRASASPTPTATTLPPGPVAVGVHRWDQLLGGECLASYPGPWAERYTVVDCATPHPAQMVFRSRFPDPATPGYPGAAALQAQMAVLCSAPGVIDLAAASAYTDAQIEASYPATAAQWDAGDHDYFCFVSRSSKDVLTGSLAAPKP